MIIAGCDYNTFGEYWAVLSDGMLERIIEYRSGKHKDFLERFIKPTSTHLIYPTSCSTPAEAIQKALTTPIHFSDWAALEGYVSHNDSGGKMAACWWDIRAKIARSDAKPLVIPPKRWKVIIGLSGNAGKAEIKAHILNLYPDLPKDLKQDAYDAVGIAYAAHLIVSPTTNTSNAGEPT